jgi:hypothetical protein
MSGMGRREFVALSLAAWPLMIWWRGNNGLPVGPAPLDTLPYPFGTLFFGIIARGLMLSNRHQT